MATCLFRGGHGYVAATLYPGVLEERRALPVCVVTCLALNIAMNGGVPMSKQQDLHAEAITYIRNLERVVDALKNAGPCPLDGYNALDNIRERLEGTIRNRLRD